MDKFMKDLFVTIAVIGNIAFWIVLKVKGLLMLGTVLFILAIIASSFVPLAGVIVFVILKLTGHLALGWGWILVPIIVSGAVGSVYADL